MENNLNAFISTIGQLESGGRYNALCGGGTFSDYSHFPQWEGFVSPDGSISHAAGKYQFQPATWARLASQLGLTDFSPASQDAAAAQLVINKGADYAVSIGDTTGAVKVLGNTWTSLKAHPLKTINTSFENFGGTIEGKKNQIAANNILETIKTLADGVQTLPNGATVDNTTIIAIAAGILFVVIGWVFYYLKKRK